MKSKTQLYMEARDHLERKIEKLKEEQVRIQNEITNTEKLLSQLPSIYE